MPESYGVDVIARVFDVSESTVLRAIHTKKLEATNVGTFAEPDWRATTKAIAAWLVQRKEQAEKARRTAPASLGRVARPSWILKGLPVDRGSRKRGR
jgi:IS4 transposase